MYLFKFRRLMAPILVQNGKPNMSPNVSSWCTAIVLYFYTFRPLYLISKCPLKINPFNRNSVNKKRIWWWLWSGKRNLWRTGRMWTSYLVHSTILSKQYCKTNIGLYSDDTISILRLSLVQRLIKERYFHSFW